MSFGHTTVRWLLLGMLALFVSMAALTLPAKAAEASTGVATWYDLTGNYTAGGDVLGYWDQTCASPLDSYGNPIYPLGSTLEVYFDDYGTYGQCVVTDTGDMSLYGIALDLNVGFARSMGLDLSQGVYEVTIVGVTPDPWWAYGAQYF